MVALDACDATLADNATPAINRATIVIRDLVPVGIVRRCRSRLNGRVPASDTLLFGLRRAFVLGLLLRFGWQAA
jgi:hypothetical protein